MTELTYQRPGTRGTSAIDMARIVIDTSGRAWAMDSAGRGRTPVEPEALAAIEAHYGATWRDAVAAMKSLQN